ncbi:flagellar biosynthesis protein FlhA [Hydrogenimonas cancrithermarum]|uniref:Flagellar biosynthesis protein FlhA n=2 Tax=Hydrogenimonas cancrithermarum TaxID=2993563 RepID=A0ABM8FIZ1_9BACT|nr:flagellar biosynthesis protein FlhA [Hydrogenimonas cancrithermarum]BDY12242.1 flagellar biosynthesis protein FlhA [Hydrogenimonas cancrithermarum]
MAKATRSRLFKRAIPFLNTIASAKDLTIVMMIVAIMGIIIVPLPSPVLDFFLTVSIALSVLMILISVFIEKPTDFTTFPTMILLITLYRLSLNIATTRMILSKGHEGPDAVSDIITSFGDFVVGGNYVIGIIVFSIIVIINFIVVTKGATRVAEVAARFTLDAMPGKQMAIDADLNAGLIDENEAKKRRAEILQEASFYGAMDGSSKFVKGDAVAGIIITIINIIGGFLIGMFQHDMALADAAQTFTLLTIGDGLVSQIPALILSTATGIIITRASKDEEKNFAEGAINQLIKEFKTLFIVGFILLMFALVPGLPTLPLTFVGLLFLGLGYLIRKQGIEESLLSVAGEIPPTEGEETENVPGARKIPTKEEEEAALEDILKVEMLELDLGYQLIKLADTSRGGDLLERIRSMRRKIAADFGFLMPQVRIRDNLQLPPNVYRILLKGVEIGSGEVYADKFLAMNSGMATEEIEGIHTKEPAFGLDAIWIDADKKEEAIIKGYTVIDPATVISTHMSELVKKHAEELLTRQEVQALLEKVKKDYPVVVDDALKVATLGLIQRVLKQLLHEQVPIRDMVTILETIADVAEYTKNVDIIVEQVRARLSRVITSLYKDQDGTIKLLTLNAPTEQKLLDHLKESEGGRQLLLNVGQINKVVETLSEEAQKVLQKGIAPVILIVDPMLRKPLAEIFERFGLEIVVLSHAEIDPNATFEVLGSVEIDI